MPYDLQTKVRAAASAGFGHVELRTPELNTYLRANTLSDLQALLEAQRVRVASLNALEFVTFRGDGYGLVQNECRELCRWASALTCPMVIAVPSPRPTWTTTWNEIKVESVRVLDDLASIAAPYGVTIGFEPLGFGWCTVRTVAGAAEILNAARADNLAPVLDLFHFYLGGAPLGELDRLDLSRLPIVHVDDVPGGVIEAITDADRVFPGEGVIPIEAICRGLAERGFSGLLSVELFRPEYWELDPDEVTRRAYASVQAIAESFFPAS
jgi:2-keto-myo-inositol isomerase